MLNNTTYDIKTTVEGSLLQVKLNGNYLYSLNRLPEEHYHLTIEQTGDQHTLWLNLLCSGRTKLYAASDAELVTRISNATSEVLHRMAGEKYSRGNRVPAWKWLIPGTVALVLAAMWSAPFNPLLTATDKPLDVETSVVLKPKAATTITAPTSPEQPAPPAVTTAVVAPAPLQQRPALSAEDAAQARQLLASRLKNSAAKETFTVSLSSGHPRTLYMFIDPECPNCRIFEPTVQALAEQYNVEIFPVTLIGKARTAEQIIPVLCAPPEKRAEMWRRTFDIGAGILNRFKEQEAQPAGCEAGQNALARNDMGFEMYRLPGTPTVFADDGRMIPLQAMSSDAALQEFLNSAQ